MALQLITTETFPATGNREVKLFTLDGVQRINYRVVSNTGQGYPIEKTLGEVLAALPAIDGTVLATYLGLIRGYLDAQLGIVSVP